MKDKLKTDRALYKSVERFSPALDLMRKCPRQRYASQALIEGDAKHGATPATSTV